MEQTIKDWANNMTRTYTWLTIKFEYSARYRTILVDFEYPSQHGNDEGFHRDALAFNDKMVDLYGDDAPLFTDNEKLFKLSEGAQVISSYSYSDYEVVTFALGLSGCVDWSKSKTSPTSSLVVEDVNAPSCDYVFDIAA